MSRWWRGFHSLAPTERLGVSFLILLALAVLFLPAAFRESHAQTHLEDRFAAPSRAYLFGADHFGRDVFSRVVYGGRLSLAVAGLAVAISFSLGVPLGLIAGYRGGRADSVLMALVDAVLPFPPLLLAMALMASLGPGVKGTIVAIGLVYTPQFARVARAVALVVRDLPFVEAERAIGAGQLRIIVRHVFPNCLGPLSVQVAVFLANAMVLEASLSFLGLGVQPPDTSWGWMVSEGLRYVTTAPWVALAPGIIMSLTILSANLLGDVLARRVDPILRRPEQTATM